MIFTPFAEGISWKTIIFMYQRDDASSNAKHETLATPEEEEEEEEKGKKRKRYREGFDTSWLDPQT